MSNKKAEHDAPDIEKDINTADVEINDISTDDDAPVQPDNEDSGNESLEEQLDKATKANEAIKKDYLFLMAEFDNFKKRTLKEKSELLKNAAESTLKGLLPIVDDFERGLDAIKDSSDASAVKEGMQLIYNKLIKYLVSNGVRPIESTGAQFDPDMHEAIAMIPAPSEDLRGKVIDTVEKGYTLNDKVIRHAKVAVGQ